VEGLRVIEADAEADGSLTVWVVTDHPGAAVCPDCGTRSARVHEQVLARPRDVRRGFDEVRVAWLKRRWKCGSQECGRKTFTESLPGVPARCRLTERLRALAGAEVAGRGCTVAEAARWQRVSWPVAHQAFARQADPVLEQPSSPVAHLGIDEHRRGRPRWRIDAETSEYVLLADRWHTCFFDLSGDQGLLGQVEGRTADDAAYWLAQAAREGQRFDRVFSSYGAVVWLSDLAAWAQGIAALLAPGGRFVLVEFHPFSMVFEWDWTLKYPYFNAGQPAAYETGIGDYVAMSGLALAPSGYLEGVADFKNSHPGYEFNWTIADILGALLGAGLAITAYREYPYANGAKLFSGMRELPGGRMVPPEGLPALPLMYGVSAELTAR